MAKITVKGLGFGFYQVERDGYEKPIYTPVKKWITSVNGEINFNQIKHKFKHKEGQYD